VLGFVWSLLNPLGMMVVFTIVFSVLMPNNQRPQLSDFPALRAAAVEFFHSQHHDGHQQHCRQWQPGQEGLLPARGAAAGHRAGQPGELFVGAGRSVCGAPALPYAVESVAVACCQSSSSSRPAFSLGIVFLLSTVQVFYRDTLIVLDVVMLAWFFLTPVFYSTSLLPATYTVAGVELPVGRLMYILNPMASLINMYRDILYWGYRTDPDFFWRTSITAFAVLAIGYWVFTQHSGDFGEEI
jgi:lipopolysaccharide transport system permease protein